MSTPILATKLYMPAPRPKIVPRPRLIDQLNNCLHHRLTLLSAPAGFGKTTLVSEWIATCQHPGAWLALDEGDRDVQQFLVYFIAALQTLEEDIGQDVWNALQASQLPPLETLLTSLLNEIASVSHDFVLVLDDYHTVESSTIDQVLIFLLDHLPSQMHLMIASREDPALHLSRLRARSQLVEVRAADLRFTPAEAAAFLNEIMGLTLSAEDIATLESRTEGWIAGLQLAALSMQGNQDIGGFIQSFSGAHQFVLDYLLEEVLDRQPESIQTFLLRTSILNRLCGPLCDAVLADLSTPNQKALEHLDHSNLFIVALDNERRWYRYHHLFGDLLRQRLGQTVSPEEIAAYHIRASEWYEKNGDQGEAFHHAIAAREFSRAANLAERAWQRMSQSFQNTAWLAWVKHLPEELIRNRPVLCTQIVWALMNTGDTAASELRLQDAEKCLDQPSNQIVVVEEEQFRSVRARIAFARTYNAQSLGNVSDTLKYAKQAFNLTPREDEYLRAQTEAILTSAHWASGDLDAARRAMHDWIQNSQSAGNTIFAIVSAYALAEILIAQGHLKEAVKTYEQSLQLASTHGREAQPFTAHHHLGLAMLFLEMGKHEAAAQHFQTGLEVGSYCTLEDWPYHKSVAQAQWKEFEGDLDAALELLDDAERAYVRSCKIHALRTS